MTLMGLAYFHKKWVLHRYMKPNNLLIGPHGQLKLGDFGLARLFGSQDHRFTHQVFARWYRAPELLFGAKAYGPAVDVWAAACIFAELLIRRPFLQGNSDIDQLGKIFAAFGTTNGLKITISKPKKKKKTACFALLPLVRFHIHSINAMADDAAKQPLLSGLLDPTPQTKKKCFAPKRRRLRHCKSAPLAGYDPVEVNGNESLPRSQSIFDKFHPSFRKVAILLAVYLSVGTVCFYIVGNQINGKKTNGVLDAVYFCIVTMTTVGYGDLVPNSATTKLLACAFVFTGMALVGLILSKAADYLVEKQETLLVKALHIHEKVNQIEIQKEIETNKVRYKCFLVFSFLLVLIVVGTIFLTTVEKLDLVDAFYCVCSTITTLGYGDKSFSTKIGRVFAIFWILMSTICLAQFFFYVAELNAESRQKALADWVLNRKITNLDLEAADLDDDGVVGAAEFIIYKLKEMGKINEEDISLVMEEFEDLDVDQSGTLSASDITLAQLSETGK